MSKISKALVGFLAVIFALTLCLPLTSLAAENGPDPSQRTLLYNKPGVVFISNYYTVHLIIKASADYPELTSSTYEVITGGTGSGFVVNPDGYIVTNGHVIKQTDDILAYNSISMAYGLIVEDIVSVEFQKLEGRAPTQQEMDQLYVATIAQLGGDQAAIDLFYQGWYSGEIGMDVQKQDVFIQQGAIVSGKKIPFEQGTKAEVKKAEYDGFTDEGEVIGKDIGILKVNESNMPSVLLGDSNIVQVGDKVNVIGYPGVATFETFFSQESQLEPSMTSGIISAEKTMADGTEIFQTDAAVTHGNSGGPAFNEVGEVIGIASLVSIDPTTGLQKEGFSYLRPIDLAKEFLTEMQVTNELGQTDKHWREGLNLYWDKHYSAAIEEFQKVKNLYPSLIDADEYITKCQEGISRGEDVPVTGSFAAWGVLGIILVLGIGFFFVVIIVIIIVVVVRKKKTPPTQTPPPTK